MALQQRGDPVSGLTFPFEAKPGPGEAILVAPGVLWARLPLPFSLDHINIWLVEDGDGWAVIDTGLRGAQTEALWHQLFTGPMGGRPVTKVVVTHLHPDHVGQAGWLCRHFGVPLWMTREEFLTARLLCLDVRDEPPPEAVDFYRRAGFTDTMMQTYMARGFGSFAQGVTDLPLGHWRLHDGGTIEIGGKDWEVVVGRGHSPEHASLWCADLGLLISGDQVLPRISSNVSVNLSDPEGDPLTDWLDSLDLIARRVPDDVMVLPSHNEPFYGLHHRLTRLAIGHQRRLDTIIEALEVPRHAVDLLGPMFRRPLTGHDLMLALGEGLAHLHCLRQRGMIARDEGADGIHYWRRLVAARDAA
jgi:glyoxylase-like metal-dependent hydrolase (beta-lactamase superfamily II)